MTVPSVRDAVSRALGGVVPTRAMASILATLPPTASQSVGTLDVVATQELVKQVSAGVKTFGGALTLVATRELRRAICNGFTPAPHEARVSVSSDMDVLVVQTRCQTLCRNFFGATDCVRLATAASELARNIYLYAKRGELTLTLTEEFSGVCLTLVARDQGPGIANVAHVLSGNYVSKTGLGRGLIGTRALLDGLEIDSAPGRGTIVKGWKRARLA